MARSLGLTTALVMLSLVAASSTIKCWKCGQYSDGVGSITPCNNRSAARLDDCPHDSKFCIKYVSELTVVRDCVPTCSEKENPSINVITEPNRISTEWWGARTYCCDTDECNAAYTPMPATVAAIIIASLSAIVFAR